MPGATLTRDTSFQTAEATILGNGGVSDAGDAAQDSHAAAAHVAAAEPSTLNTQESSGRAGVGVGGGDAPGGRTATTEEHHSHRHHVTLLAHGELVFAASPHGKSGLLENGE